MKTRAQEDGIKPGTLASRAKSRLAKAKEMVSAAVAPYGDIDNNLEIAARDLIAHIEELSASIDATTEWLNEPREA